MLPEFYPIAADFDPCCWKLTVELREDKVSKEEIRETCKFLTNFSYSRVKDKIYKRKRGINQVNHHRLLLDTLFDFHVLCNQPDEIEAVRNSSLFKETSEIILATLDDSEFSFTSIESSELLPDEPEAWIFSNVNNVTDGNDSFFNDDFSSDLDFVSQ